MEVGDAPKRVPFVADMHKGVGIDAESGDGSSVVILFLLAAAAGGAISAILAFAAQMSLIWIFLAYVSGGIFCAIAAALIVGLRRSGENRGPKNNPGNWT